MIAGITKFVQSDIPHFIICKTEKVIAVMNFAPLRGESSLPDFSASSNLQRFNDAN